MRKMRFTKKAASFALAAMMTFGTFTVVPHENNFGITASAATFAYIDNFEQTLYSDRVEVRWGLVYGAQTYLVTVCDITGYTVKSFICGNTTSSMMISYDYLTSGNDYYITVIAFADTVPTSKLPANSLDDKHKFTYNADIKNNKKYGAIENLKGTSTTNSITVTWDNNSNVGTYYSVHVVDQRGSLVLKASGIARKTYTITGLMSGQTYTVTVYNNALGTSAYVDVTVKKPEVEQSKPKEYTYPAPKNLKVVKNSKGLYSLKWNKVSGASAYSVYIYNTETRKYDKYKTVGSAACSLKTLPTGTHKVRVAAVTYDSATKKYTRTGEMTAPLTVKIK